MPLTETNNRLSPRKSNTSPSKIIKTVSTENADSKENVDVAVEINILTSSNVQVDVQVEERQLEDGENMETIFKKMENSSPKKEAVSKSDNGSTEQCKNEPILRTTSKNRLQRLGALYSGITNVRYYTYFLHEA